MKIVNMYATAYLDEKGIKKAGKSKEVSPEEKIATLEKKVKSLSSKKMMLYSDYKDDKLTREECSVVKRVDTFLNTIFRKDRITPGFPCRTPLFHLVYNHQAKSEGV